MSQQVLPKQNSKLMLTMQVLPKQNSKLMLTMQVLLKQNFLGGNNDESYRNPIRGNYDY